jgi:hypothetical protein
MGISFQIRHPAKKTADGPATRTVDKMTAGKSDEVLNYTMVAAECSVVLPVSLPASVKNPAQRAGSFLRSCWRA